MAGRGVPARELAIDWPELVRFKRTLTDPGPELTERGWTRLVFVGGGYRS